ncbi:VPA1269 family protein, partial [Dokdonella sp.]|uniref:VPA1269 family protein n=1 Tax=Dokdonella sp. TaxID=2291710 RepID=UPI003784E0FB
MKHSAVAARPFPKRSDPRFTWAASHPQLDAWRNALAEWVGQRSSRRAAVEVGNALLDFAREAPTLRTSPEVVCRRQAPHGASFNDWLSGTPKNRPAFVNLAHEFFAWYLDKHLSAADDYGQPVRSPNHFNPVPRRIRNNHSTETSRDPLPTRYVRELRRLLMADDWAWAKKQRRDWVAAVDTQTGERVQTWCPVR